MLTAILLLFFLCVYVCTFVCLCVCLRAGSAFPAVSKRAKGELKKVLKVAGEEICSFFLVLDGSDSHDFIVFFF